MQSPSFRPVIASVCAWLLGFVVAPAQAQNTNCFCPRPNDVVNAVAVQATDGKIVFGGAFTTVNSQAHSRVARLLPDGSLDASFVDPMVDGAVDGLVLQSDGKIVIGGSFAHVGTFARNNLARLNADGSLDTAYDPNVTYTSGFATVFALALQSDGKVVLGGHFTTIGATPRSNIARLNTDGSVDNAFNPSTDSPSTVFVQQADSKVVVGGAFGGVDGTTRFFIARINGSNGSLDTTYDPNPNSEVVALSLQPDGKIVIGGYFTTIGSTSRNAIARVNTNGSLDTTYDPNATLFPNTAYVLAMARQADGKLVVGGAFSMIGVTFLENIARLYPDGIVDGERIFANGFE